MKPSELFPYQSLRTAVVDAESSLSFIELNHELDHRSQCLSENGVCSGDIVATWMPSSIDHVLTLLALWETGAVVCPLHTRWTVHQVDQALQTVGCNYVVGLSTHDFTEVVHWNDFSVVLPEDIAAILFTSGTTGQPKGVVHSWKGLVSNAQAVNESLVVTPESKWLLALPLHHSAGLAIVLRCLVAQAELHICEAQSNLQAMADKATHASLVSTQLGRLTDRGSLEAVLVGGSKIPGELLDRARAKGIAVHTSYGMTEMGSTITIDGNLLPERELTLVDGEICIKGAPLCAGYLVEQILDDPRDSEGWLHTGDLGEWKDGKLHVIGRVDRQFVSGGENIQPQAIEEAIRMLSGVTNVRVDSVKDEVFGQRPVAYIETNDQRWLDLPTLRKALSHTLPRYQHPVEVYLAESNSN